MGSEETKRHSFVIRIWAEETGEDVQTTWRGHITHVLSGKQIYLKDLESILTFIKPYLRVKGVKD